MKKRLLSLGIILCILLGFAVVPTSAEVSAWDGSVAAGFESGSGTEEDPYIIKTAPQLAYLAQRVNSGRTYEGQYILLVNDIVLNTSDMFATDENGNITGAASDKTPYEWTAIGNYNPSNSSERPFSGTFDGGNHEIKGIYINKPETSYQGLFGCCRNAAVKNIGVTGGYICGYNYVGGVVGDDYASFGGTATVSNCYNTGSVTGCDSVGGVVGYSYADEGDAAVSDCYNTGSVTGSGNSVGGVVGCNVAHDRGGIATVSDCYNKGSVTGGNSVGGVVGDNYCGTVSNCYNTGSVTGGNSVGGVVGHNNDNANYSGSTGTVSDCYYLDSCIETANGYGVALTSSQMEQQASFAGFDFDTVWTMEGNPDYPYPELIGMYYGGSSPIIDEPIENKGIIKIGTAKGKAGRTVDVTVSLENNPGITSMLLNIDYDNSALTLTNVADSGILGSTCHSDNFANAPYSLYWNNGTATENFTANGVIATLTFEIDEGAYVGDYPITVWYNSDDILDFDLDEVYFDTENGNVSVISFIYGDVNGDEKITLKDDAFLARYLAHWIGYDETNVDLDAADVNADGKVGVRDNAILARHLAKWIGYEELPYVR